MKIRSPLVHIQGPSWMCIRLSHFFNHQLSCLQSDFVMCDGQFGKRKHWSLRGNFHSWSTSILLFWFNYTHDEELLRPCSPCTWPSGPFDWWLLLPTVSINFGGPITPRFSMPLLELDVLRSPSCLCRGCLQVQSLFCRRYEATRRCPYIEEKLSRLSWVTPSARRTPPGRKLTGYLGGFGGEQPHLRRLSSHVQS